jgi:hypothetical protein
MFGDDAGRTAVEAQLVRIREAMAPYAAARRYYNFVEADVDASTFFDAETLARLERIRSAVDPRGMFRANHPIRATGHDASLRRPAGPGKRSGAASAGRPASV